MTLERPAPIDLVVDTSAIMAIALNEQSASAVQRALESVRGPVISSATIVELSIVAASRVGADGRAAVRAILEASGVVTMQSMICKPISPSMHGCGSGRAIIRLDSITATASHTPSHII